jgi:hypothetical protein
MGWVVVPALDELRNQLNEAFPNRDKASDGSIGDYAHSIENSDHNPDDTGQGNAGWDSDPDTKQEVRARDFDNNLNDPDVSAEEVVQHLLKYCRNGTFWWIRYIIYNKRWWHKDSNFVQKPYTGASPHTEHFHVSNDHTQSADQVTGCNYRLDELVALSDDDINKIAAAVITKFRNTADDLSDTERIRSATQVLAQKMDGTSAPGNTYQRGIVDMFPDVWQLMFFGRTKGGDPIPSAGVYGQILGKLGEIQTALEALETPSSGS